MTPPQASYAMAMTKGFAGMKADSEFDHVASLLGKEKIRPGLGLVKFAGVDNAVRLPLVNEVTVTFDIDFTATNVISGIINGVAYTATWSTNQATTLALVVAAMLAVPGVFSATGGTKEVVLIADPNGALAVTCSVADGGGSTVTTTVVDTTTDEIYGVSLHTHTLEKARVEVDVNDKAVITLSTDLITGNSTIVTIDGVALTAVVFTTSHAITMTLLCAEIDSAPGVSSCSYSGDVITVLASLGLELTVNSVAITSGATQPTVSIVHSNQTAAGEVFYRAMSAISGLRKGAVMVVVEETVTSDDDVYVRYKTSGADLPGQFRKDADSNTAVAFSGAKYREGASAGAVAVVEFNLP